MNPSYDSFFSKASFAIYFEPSLILITKLPIVDFAITFDNMRNQINAWTPLTEEKWNVHIFKNIQYMQYRSTMRSVHVEDNIDKFIATNPP